MKSGRSAAITARIAKALVTGTSLLASALLAQLASPASAQTVVPGGYAISVDGEVIAGSGKLPGVHQAGEQAAVDRSLDEVDIQVKFDGLGVKPILNVTTDPIRRTYVAGEKIKFSTTTNYGDWLSRAEIRIFARDNEKRQKPLFVLPVDGSGQAQWSMPGDGPREFTYVLRVYDAEGRFDETIPLDLLRTTEPMAVHAPDVPAVAAGEAQDRTALRNIRVYGGSVTVYGSNVPEGYQVQVMGRQVPVDAEGKFVAQRILPVGDHDVAIKLVGRDSKGISFDRDINIPSSEWFYVALADLTVGHRFGGSAVKAARPGEFDNVYTKGRLAFYLKGKIKGETLLTAAADTGENNLKNMLKGLDGKDPRQFLARIDPEKYYPVYGDDSTSVEDAPTRGKFYVRLERGDSHVMWGNFKTEITGTRFLRDERALYGASGVYRSSGTVPSGQHRSELHGYAALPGTLPARDLLRGTGGSAYFLKHQDLTVGSETLTIVVVNPVTGAVMQRVPMRYGEDYTIDYVQGLVLLTRPLESTAAGSSVVHAGPGGGAQLYLGASYEYTPAVSSADGYVGGGRAQQWLGDHVRVGVTGHVNKSGLANQKMASADVHLEHSAGTYLDAEVAASKGPGFGLSQSLDGGLTSSDTPTAGLDGVLAKAYTLDGRVDLADLTNGGVKGDFAGHFTRQEDGFASLDEQVPVGKRDWGVTANVEPSPFLRLTSDYAAVDLDDGRRQDEMESHADIRVNDRLTLSPGVRYSNRKDPAALGMQDLGQRVDAGLKLTYQPDDGHEIYAAGQATLAKDGNRYKNSRVAIGGRSLLTEKTDVSGEVSYGSRGVGAAAKLSYHPTADDSYYIGYVLDPDRSFDPFQTSAPVGDDLGKVIGGAKHQYSEALSVFAEDSYDLFGVRRTLAQTYGVTYTPTANWTFGGNIELGHVVDSTINPLTLAKNSDFDRKAFSGTVGYTDENGNSGRSKAEIRFENSDDGTRDLTQYLLSQTVAIKANPDWRFIGNVDAVITDATDSTLGGTYVEASLGYAYRPVDNDRLNMLARYTFLYDVPASNQVDVSGTTNGHQQRSHIFSVDGNYDVTPYLTLGAKYGFRVGETKARDGTTGWEKGSAHLGVMRADVNIAQDWDLLVEGRALWLPPAENTRLGGLVAGYRRINDNFKIGLGYNFSNFSDDLRDQSYSSQGIFLNAVGQL